MIVFFSAGNSVNVEGAVPTEQEINHPKPSKRARTSFTTDQLQVNLHHHRNHIISSAGETVNSLVITGPEK